MSMQGESIATPTVDEKLEVIVLPVADDDRAKRFYMGLGWRLDADFRVGEDGRRIQLTPPGSECSIQFGRGITNATPGSSEALIAVDDIDRARNDLLSRGANVSEVFHFEDDQVVTGPSPDHLSYRTWATFRDPDGNTWLLQEIRERLPGRVSAPSTKPEIATLTKLLREAEEHHGAYDASAPKHHWSDWYAAYIVAIEHGRTSEEAARDAARHLEEMRTQTS